MVLHLQDRAADTASQAVTGPATARVATVRVAATSKVRQFGNTAKNLVFQSIRVFRDLPISDLANLKFCGKEFSELVSSLCKRRIDD